MYGRGEALASPSMYWYDTYSITILAKRQLFVTEECEKATKEKGKALNEWKFQKKKKIYCLTSTELGTTYLSHMYCTSQVVRRARQPKKFDPFNRSAAERWIIISKNGTKNSKPSPFWEIHTATILSLSRTAPPLLMLEDGVCLRQRRRDRGSINKAELRTHRFSLRCCVSYSGTWTESVRSHCLRRRSYVYW